MATHYHPWIFDVGTIGHAKSVILTDEGPGEDPETRWVLETPYVLELIGRAFGLRPGMLVLDYGCGIGRMAKAMIDASGCGVIGVDISASMLALAAGYVRSDRFVAMTPGQFDLLVAAGLRADVAISVWVLQHCFAPADDIARIERGLAPGGRAFVLNLPQRAVPALRDDAPAGAGFVWMADGIDVGALLRGAFEVAAEGTVDRARMPKMADAGAFWMGLRRRKPRPEPAPPKRGDAGRRAG